MAKSAKLEKFESIFPKLVEDLLDHAKTYNLPDQAVNWFKDVRAHSSKYPMLSTVAVC